MEGMLEGGSTHRWYMIHVRFLHHRRHGFLHRSVSEFIVGVLVPDLFEVKERPAHMLFQEGQGTSVRNARRRDLKIRVAGNNERR